MKKILVANRGEIACRVIKSLKKLGIKSVAIYSEVDRNAPHVTMADEALCVGPAPSSESYLRGDHIIELALSLGVEGIHPGYGFLSENAAFSDAVTKAGMTFIGPSAHSIKIMGSKLQAKAAVKEYDIPMVPGSEGAIDDIPTAIEVAKSIGFPILIKASAGGGGKGMRIVKEESDFVENLERAMSEAQNAFGDPSVFIEKYVSSPRHIEFQILGDHHGNYVHLFERECSVQRRHQKVVEEAPSAVLTPELRDRMGKDAINVARSCDYFSTGTVEFLLDEDLNYYFLEMNTRLQVEHPVSELITGTDLVEMQIHVARGEKLPMTQESLGMNGHAIELRVYAEDADENFMPSIGTLERYVVPVGNGIRVDGGFEEGMDIPIYYDPMISKLITYGATRDEAMNLMIKAIKDYHIEGVKTTLDFGRFVMEHEAFRSGHFDTHFVSNYWTDRHAGETNGFSQQLGVLASRLMDEHRSKLKV